jgi:hypothetical protein
MKKLTPFQKKLARWYMAHKVVYGLLLNGGPFVLIIITLVAIPAGLIVWAYPKEGGAIIQIIAFGILCCVTTPFFLLGAWLYRKYIFLVYLWMLPECAVKEARDLIEKYPDLADLLENRMNMAVAEDDGMELALYLNKIRAWDSMKNELAAIQKNEKEIAAKIAALEKELGMK